MMKEKNNNTLSKKGEEKYLELLKRMHELQLENQSENLTDYIQECIYLLENEQVHPSLSLDINKNKQKSLLDIVAMEHINHLRDYDPQKIEVLLNKVIELTDKESCNKSLTKALEINLYSKLYKFMDFPKQYENYNSYIKTLIYKVGIENIDYARALSIIEKFLSKREIDNKENDDLVITAQKLLDKYCIESIKSEAPTIKLIEYQVDNDAHVLLRNLLKNLSKLTNFELESINLKNIDTISQEPSKQSIVFIHAHGNKFSLQHNTTFILEKLSKFSNLEIINTACYGSYSVEDIFNKMKDIGGSNKVFMGFSVNPLLFDSLSQSLVKMFLSGNISSESYLECYKDSIKASIKDESQRYIPSIINIDEEGIISYKKENLKSSFSLSFREIEYSDVFINNQKSELEINSADSFEMSTIGSKIEKPDIEI